MFEMVGSALGFLLARLGFAAVLAFLAVGNLADLDGSAAYADGKGVPFARASVAAGSLLLLAGAGSIALGVYPAAGAVATALFLLVVTPTMHDFWAQEGEAAENELVHFLKNVGLLAAALAFLALAGVEWPYALGSVV